jgi:hypothetical protein
MTDEEAVRLCWWTTSVAETVAIGTTSNALAGLHFNGTEYQREPWSNPGKLGWTVFVPRFVPGPGETRVENPTYRLVMAEIKRRKEER